MNEDDLKEVEERMKAHLHSDEYKKAVEERLTEMEREEQVIEEAAWIGKTGLPEEWERQLPQYLRREFGESLFDENSLKAADLEYVGAFPEREGSTHYWRVPYQGRTDVFAYVEDFENGAFGWGDKASPV
jgi:hypothetical protein